MSALLRPDVRYWHVDAFAARPFTGNQAAVMPLGAWLPDDLLQAIAAENMFAETAFCVPDTNGGADWELRWFTPLLEVALCGHATLACGHVLLERDGGERVTFRTRRSGLLEVCRAEAGYELALPAIATVEGAPDRLEEMLGGAAALEARSNAGGYSLFRFEDEATVRGLRPDMNGLAMFGDFMVICTAPGDRTDVVSRVFVPGGGIGEDSVTGSAHAVLTPYWAERLGRERLTAHQASQRGGDLVCRLDGDRVWLGGQCVTVVEGRFYLS
jgi:predicted PhzF superfamily epimerase YddE/YHI9